MASSCLIPSTSTHARSCLIVWLLFLVSAALGQTDQDGPAADFETRPETFTPARPRSDAEADRVLSVGFYAHGRLLHQRGEHAKAIRRYQRAWRYHPEAVEILPEIVFLASNLGWQDEAARYAVLAADRVEMDVQVLRRLGLLLAARDQWQESLKLFEKAAAAERPAEAAAEDAAVLALQHLEMGRLYFLDEKYEEAAEMLGRVTAAAENPDRQAREAVRKMIASQAERTKTLLAESLLKIGKLDAAEKHFRDVYRDNKQAALLAFALARIAAARNQTEEALTQLNAYFTAHETAGRLEPYELLRELLAKQHTDADAARAALATRQNELLADDPTNQSLLLFQAESQRQQMQWSEAAQSYAKLLVLRAERDVYEGLLMALLKLDDHEQSLMVLGEALAHAGSLSELPDVDQMLKETPAIADRLLALAEEKRASAEDKLTLHQSLAAAWLALRRSQLDKAETYFQRVGAELGERRGPVTMGWAIELLIAKHYEHAVRLLERAIADKISPDDDVAFRSYLLRALAFAARTDEALRVATELAAERPKSPQLQSQPAWVLYFAKRDAEAEQAYRKLIDTFDDQHDSLAVRETLHEARLILSNLCVRQEKTVEAEEWLEQVLDEFPADRGALNDLGYLWTEQGKRLHRALAMIQQAVADDPNNAAYLDSLGWAYFQLGRYAEAIETLERAAAGDDPDGVILDHLGDAYRKADRRDQALAAWRRAAEHFEKQQDHKHLERTLQKIQRQQDEK
jgi:tetratricopeptide (TPR) repeat protein